MDNLFTGVFILIVVIGVPVVSILGLGKVLNFILEQVYKGK